MIGNERRTVKRLLKILAVMATVVILGTSALIAVTLYGNWHAERRALAFCEATSIGSAISTAVARADKEKIPWASDRFYIFFFPGAFFDKAICQVQVDQSGRVVKKLSEMEND